MRINDLLAGLSCGVMLLGLTINGAHAEDQVRSYFLNDVPRMKAECREAGGTWRTSYCDYSSAGSSTASSGGSGAGWVIAAGGLLCLMDPKDCRELFTGSDD